MNAQWLPTEQTKYVCKRRWARAQKKICPPAAWSSQAPGSSAAPSSRRARTQGQIARLQAVGLGLISVCNIWGNCIPTTFDMWDPTFLNYEHAPQQVSQRPLLVHRLNLWREPPSLRCRSGTQKAQTSHLLHNPKIHIFS